MIHKLPAGTVVGEHYVIADWTPHARSNEPSNISHTINLGCQYLGPILPDESFPPPDGLGDLVGNVLTAIGLTKERWANLVTSFKIEHTPDKGGCGGCGARQKFLNWAGEKLGLSKGKGSELQTILEMQSLPKLPVYACEVHEKCLPTLNVNESTNEQLIASGWHGCGRCTDKVLKQEIVK